MTAGSLFVCRLRRPFIFIQTEVPKTDFSGIVLDLFSFFIDFCARSREIEREMGWGTAGAMSRSDLARKNSVFKLGLLTD